jgi:two-component system sensor histidine kinase KdpD
MAASLRAEWYAVHVETPAALRLSPADRARLSENLRLAEQLGAETVTLSGERAAEEILRFAREKNVTKIVAGKPRRSGASASGWAAASSTSSSAAASDIDIYVTVGDEGEAGPRGERRASAARSAGPPIVYNGSPRHRPSPRSWPSACSGGRTSPTS